MMSNLTTFQGSLGNLVQELRVSARNHFTNAAIKNFPETEFNKTISGDGLASLCDYNKYPDLRSKLIKERKVWINIPFFDRDMPSLFREVYAPLYSVDEAEIKKVTKSLKQFYRRLKKIRQYYKRSRGGEGERTFANEDISLVLRDLQSSTARRFENWIMGGCSPDIGKVDDLILRAESWAAMLSGSKKKGRPANRFSLLVFHIVNKFTRRAFTNKHESIMKDGKYRVRKNWQLICAAILWIHVRKGIPELKEYINEHKDEEANKALRTLTDQIKKEYSNLRRTGKGTGKFQAGFPDGSGYLDIFRVYEDESGSIHQRRF